MISVQTSLFDGSLPWNFHVVYHRPMSLIGCCI